MKHKYILRIVDPDGFMDSCYITDIPDSTKIQGLLHDKYDVLSIVFYGKHCDMAVCSDYKSPHRALNELASEWYRQAKGAHQVHGRAIVFDPIPSNNG